MMINGRLPGSIKVVFLPINEHCKNTPVVEDKIVIVSLLYAWRIRLLLVIDINWSAAAKVCEAAAITEVAITAATVAIAKGKIDASLFASVVGCRWGYTLSEAEQSGPATSSANGMMSVVDGWSVRLWFVDYLVSSHWFLAVDHGGEADFWREKKNGVSGKGLIVVHSNEVIWALVTHSYLMTKLTGFLLGKKVK